MPTALEINIRSLSNSKASVGIFTLPGGYLDSEGVVHDEAQVREMTGAEEDVLAGKGTIMSKLNTILASCLVRIGTITDKNRMQEVVMNLPAVDRICLLVMIRSVSIGDEYSFDAVCPSCRDKSVHTINLSTLPVKEMPDKTKRFFDIQTPSGKIVQIKTLLGKDEAAASDIAQKFPNDLSSALMLARVTQIDGKPAALQDTKSLSWKDLSFLRKELRAHDGDLDTKAENTCQKCNNDFSIDLDIGSQSFFYP